jgi:hypothetical protein
MTMTKNDKKNTDNGKKQYVILVGDSDETAVGFIVEASSKPEAMQAFVEKWPEEAKKNIIGIERFTDDKFPKLTEEEMAELLATGEIDV